MVQTEQRHVQLPSINLLNRLFNSYPQTSRPYKHPAESCLELVIDLNYSKSLMVSLCKIYGTFTNCSVHPEHVHHVY